MHILRHTSCTYLRYPSLMQFLGRSWWDFSPHLRVGLLSFCCALPSAARLIQVPSVWSRPPSTQFSLTHNSRSFGWQAWHLVTSTHTHTQLFHTQVCHTHTHNSFTQTRTHTHTTFTHTPLSHTQLFNRICPPPSPLFFPAFPVPRVIRSFNVCLRTSEGCEQIFSLNDASSSRQGTQKAAKRHSKRQRVYQFLRFSAIIMFFSNSTPKPNTGQLDNHWRGPSFFGNRVAACLNRQFVVELQNVEGQRRVGPGLWKARSASVIWSTHNSVIDSLFTSVYGFMLWEPARCELPR